ncbi:hypothetical protein NE237_029912 [Protea cynaroides]|uniref:Uncharacterized protein n=1 Tax=Protea cynaroides TaxID=273540 RepID=A0A9Q0GV56_9MAGN|nr:hypothetical protein NE237_029912 [Protea cynaroides]
MGCRPSLPCCSFIQEKKLSNLLCGIGEAGEPYLWTGQYIKPATLKENFSEVSFGLPSLMFLEFFLLFCSVWLDLGRQDTNRDESNSDLAIFDQQEPQFPSKVERDLIESDRRKNV